MSFVKFSILSFVAMLGLAASNVQAGDRNTYAQWNNRFTASGVSQVRCYCPCVYGTPAVLSQPVPVSAAPTPQTQQGVLNAVPSRSTIQPCVPAPQYYHVPASSSQQVPSYLLQKTDPRKFG